MLIQRCFFIYLLFFAGVVSYYYLSICILIVVALRQKTSTNLPRYLTSFLKMLTSSSNISIVVLSLLTSPWCLRTEFVWANVSVSVTLLSPRARSCITIHRAVVGEFNLVGSSKKSYHSPAC